MWNYLYIHLSWFPLKIFGNSTKREPDPWRFSPGALLLTPSCSLLNLRKYFVFYLHADIMLVFFFLLVLFCFTQISGDLERYILMCVTVCAAKKEYVKTPCRCPVTSFTLQWLIEMGNSFRKVVYVFLVNLCANLCSFDNLISKGVMLWL